MYNCKLCRRTKGPRIPQHRVVVERKLKAKGWEIAREIGVCQSCEDSLKKEEEVANGR